MSEEEKEKPSFLKRYIIVIILFVFVTYLLPVSIHLFVHLTGLSNYENRLILQFYLLWSANLLLLIGIISVFIVSGVWILKNIIRMSISPILKIISISSLLFCFIVAMKICFSCIIANLRMLFLLK